MQREENAAIKFSVIVPVYNAQNYLFACVKSVAEQPGPADWELLLVDDGSTDAGAKMCDALAEDIPGVVALHQENAGPSTARNAGMAAARGEFLLFLDSDDRWQPGMLAELRRALTEQPGYDWYVAQYLEYDDATGQTAPPGEIDFAAGVFTSEDYAERVARLYRCGHWAVWKYCLRRTFVEKARLRFWKESDWAEDCAFDLLLLRKCKTVCYLPMVMTVYRANRSGSLANSRLVEHLKCVAKMWLHMQAVFTVGAFLPAEQQEIKARLADVFWPDARAAAVRDKELRRACADPIARCRPLYNAGHQGTGRADWTLYRLLLQYTGPRFGLWAASLLHKS